MTQKRVPETEPEPEPTAEELARKALAIHGTASHYRFAARVRRLRRDDNDLLPDAGVSP